MDIQQLTDTFTVMRKQESSMCQRCDHFPVLENVDSNTAPVIDKKCRFQMAIWYFQVVDFFNFRRETIGIALSNLDRYISTTEGNFVLYDKYEFQLAAICSLIIASKLQEPLNTNIALFSAMSQGLYSSQEIKEMEKHIISALKWRMSPPTAFTFLNYFLELFSGSHMPSLVKENIMALSQQQIDYAVKDYSFTSYKPSSVALASVMNTIDLLRSSNSISDLSIQSFRRDIFLIAGISSEDIFCVCQVKEKLKAAVPNASDFNRDAMFCGVQTHVSCNTSVGEVLKI